MSNVVDHRHCEICGKIVSVDVRWCSDDCKEKYDEGQKLKKRQAILIVLMVLFVLILPYTLEALR